MADCAVRFSPLLPFRLLPCARCPLSLLQLVRNKNICRSSTLAIQVEAIFNNLHAKTKDIFGSVWGALSGGFGGAVGGAGPQGAASGQGGAAGGGRGGAQQPSSVVQVGLEGQRAHDIQLLLHTATTCVADLMVERQPTRTDVHARTQTEGRARCH